MVDLAVAHTTTPFVTAYPWSATGFGAKFADPATLPGSNGRGVAYSSADDALVLGNDSSPFTTAYPWSGAGFGAKFADPATPPTGIGRGVVFTAADDFVAVAHNTTPFVSAYPWSGAGFGAKVANPATLPASTGRSVKFTTADDAIMVAHDTTPFVTAYPWTGVFGAKFANPATLPPSSGLGTAFTAADDFVAVAHIGSPFVSVYPWSGAGFGAKVANPATLPAGNGLSVAYTTADNAIAVGHSTTPFVSVYPWSGAGFGAKVANPATLPASASNGVAFTFDDDAIAVATDTTPFVTAYPWTGVFGAKFSDPATLPGGNSNGVSYTNLTAPVPPTPGLAVPQSALEADRLARRAQGLVVLESIRQYIKLVWVNPVIVDANRPSNLVAASFGGNCDADPTQLPGVTFTWDAPTVPAGMNWARYDVWRRTLGADDGGFYSALTGDWDRIAILSDDISTTTYTDLEVASRWGYQYAVSVVYNGIAAQLAVGPLAAEIAIGTVEFDFLFLHTTAADFVRLDTLAADKTRNRRQRQLPIWGRAKPVVAMTEDTWHQLRIPALNRQLVPTEDMWWRLQAMMDNEYSNEAQIVTRFGKARELYYAQFTSLRQRQHEEVFQPDVDMVEVFHDWLGGTFPGFG